MFGYFIILFLFAQQHCSNAEAPIWHIYKPEKFIDVQLDHFSFDTTETFKLRYLESNSTRKDCNQPVFLYIGGQDEIERYAHEAGFVFELAQYFEGTAVFIEHRYYGKSVPSLNKSAQLDFNHLTISQALADIAHFVLKYKTELLNCEEAPFIAVGGFYSGALAAWARLKYPHLIHGALASSAPVLYFDGGNVEQEAFAKHTTEVYLQKNCSEKAVTGAWKAIKLLARSADGREKLNTIFHLSNTSLLESELDKQYLIDYVRTGLQQIAVLNYPYDLEYPKRVPASPVQKACKLMIPEYSTDEVLLKNLYEAVNIYYNKSEHCIKPTCIEEDPLALIWQKCTEWSMEKCVTGKDDAFIPSECNDCGLTAKIKAKCEAKLNKTTYQWEMYTTKAISEKFGFSFRSASNIVFTNGALDPWLTGGITSSKVDGEVWQRGLYTFEMANSAHQLDLKQPNSCDPPAVKFVREKIIKSIVPIMVSSAGFEKIVIPEFATSNTTNCKFLYKPWANNPLPTKVSTMTSSGNTLVTSATLASTAKSSTTISTEVTTTTSSSNKYLSLNFVFLLVFTSLMLLPLKIL